MQFDVAQRKRLRSETLVSDNLTDPLLNNNVIKTKRSRIFNDAISDKDDGDNTVADTSTNNKDNSTPPNSTANDSNRDEITADTSTNDKDNSTPINSTTDEGTVDEGIADEGIADEGIADDEIDDTCTITSQNQDDFQILTLSGRTFCNDHWQPNDSTQTRVLRKYYKSALDIGTGSGDWAIEFADRNTHIYVIGIDISLIQPDFIPPNLEFQRDDCNHNWTFRPSSMDYIHIQDLKGSVYWDKLAPQVYITLAEGGIVEIHEGSVKIYHLKGQLPRDSHAKQWNDLFSKAGEIRGNSFEVVESKILINAVKRAHFKDIEVYEFDVPLGSWASLPNEKKIGKRHLKAFVQDIEGWILRPARESLGWSKEQCRVFALGLRRELESTTAELYMKRLVVIGRKISSP
ncbi:hypothetical protein F53441_12122 [Fusarium austroafricanum]|uniref:Methyltransferase domain-containing protein n=1 Tax=Fusarium austroafricanum TaxID=2364996 RepID=A0A8H4JY28_9HYPO|nr:hypothetical protein F53441_12122 [Fusarium austroafricanum]